jgi:hypothetical protein
MSLVSAAYTALQAFEKQDKREGIVKQKNGGRRANENFEKRKRSLLRKCNETVKLYDADLYIVARRKGKCTVYSSCFVSTWPPRQEDMVSLYPLTSCVLTKYVVGDLLSSSCCDDSGRFSKRDYGRQGS